MNKTFTGNFLGDVLPDNAYALDSLCIMALEYSELWAELKPKVVTKLDHSDTDIYVITKEDDGLFLNYVSNNIATLDYMKDHDVDSIFFEPSNEKLHEIFKNDMRKLILNNIGNLGTQPLRMRWISTCVLQDDDGDVRNAVSREHLVTFNSGKEV